MEDRPSVSRRSVLAGAGAVAVTAVAGCSGDGDSEGENGTDGGGTGTAGNDAATTATEMEVTPTEQEMDQPKGELVDSQTITDTRKEWEYELDEGDTITVLAKAEREHTRITASIHGPKAMNMETIDNVGRGSMQLSAEENGTFMVPVDTGGTLTVEIYIER